MTRKGTGAGRPKVTCESGWSCPWTCRECRHLGPSVCPHTNTRDTLRLFLRAWLFPQAGGDTSSLVLELPQSTEGRALKPGSAVLPSPAPKGTSVHIGLLAGVLVLLGLGPELLPGVWGFLCRHHCQPMLVVGSEAVNLRQVGVPPLVLELEKRG